LHAYLGIDLGTSGCRGVAIDAKGGVLAESAVELPGSRSEYPGESRQNPADWWQAVLQILTRLTQRLREVTIEAIAIDATSSTLLLCDFEGEPLTPALMYDDSQGRSALTRLSRTAPPDSPVLSATSSLAKLLHLREGIETDAFIALHQADWIMGRLCERFPVSDENNCLKLGYDPIERGWPDWLQALSLPSTCLPTVLANATPVGKLTQPLAERTGLTNRPLIVTGTTDSNAAFIASGADSVGDAVTSLGSTLVLKILSDKPVFSAQHGVYSHRLGDRWLVSGASNSGGAVCRAFFSDEEIARFTEQMQPLRPIGLDYYPLLRPGERFPLNDRELQPKLSPRPADDSRFFQAMLEGITRIEQTGYARLQRLGAPPPRQVISIGGGAVNEPWRVMRERALGVPVVRAVQQEAAYGAAILARRGVTGSGKH
jgi:D-ribulokinase